MARVKGEEEQSESRSESIREDLSGLCTRP